MIESYPSSVWLREPIEAYVLKIRDPNTNQLKPPADWVGTYTLPGGQKIPAVYVVGANMVPSDWVIEGIECAINEVPEIAPIASTINGVIAWETWTVRFTNYGTNRGTKFNTTLLDFCRRMGRLYSNAAQSYQPRTDITYETMIARVRVANLQTALP